MIQCKPCLECYEESVLRLGKCYLQVKSMQLHVCVCVFVTVIKSCQFDQLLCADQLIKAFPLIHQLFNYVNRKIPTNLRKLTLMLSHKAITWFTKVMVFCKILNK